MAKNKYKGSLDTNVLLRLLLGDVPAQAEAIESLFAKLWTFDTDLILADLVHVKGV